MNFYVGNILYHLFIYLYTYRSQTMMVECYVDANMLRKQKSAKINENQQILEFL